MHARSPDVEAARTVPAGRAAQTTNRAGRVERYGSTTRPAAPRPGTLEAAYVAAAIRDPEWLRCWSVAPSWITTHEPLRAYQALRELVAEGAVVSADTVAARSGIPVRVLMSFEWDADVPRMWRTLRRRAARRSLHLLSEALTVAADDEAADLGATCERVAGLLVHLAAEVGR